MPRTKLLAFLFGAAGVAPVSSSLIASVEDEGAAAGGGGATTHDPAAASGAAPVTPAAPAAPAAPAGERTFTQADLDRIVADRLARDRAARGGVTPSAPPAPPAAQDRGGLTLAQRQDLLEQQTTFYRELLRIGVKLTEEQEADVFQLFRNAKPERPGEWMTRKVAAFGLGAQPQPTAASPVTAASTTPPAAPAAAGTPSAPAAGTAPAAASGAAPNGVDQLAPGGLIDVSKLNSAQIAALGPKGIREAVEGVLASGQGRDGRPALPAALRNRKA